MSGELAKKPLLSNTLWRFGRICPENACAQESGFVNHRFASVSNQLLKAFPGAAADAACRP
jgi:hypothetical protein